MKTLSRYLLLFIIAFTYSCDNEPVDLTTISADDAITVDSELYNNIERITDDNPIEALVCIEFTYVFTLNIFDENLEFVGVQIIGSDQEFSAFLGSLQDDYSISMSYPITSITNDGTLVEINNNDDLKTIIDGCLQDEVIGYCNGLLTEPDCIWKVIPNDEGNTDYENAYFDVSDIGSTSFFYEDNVYFGTWISFFIQDELHLNINLTDEGTVGDDWNIDWKLTIVDENNMILVHEDRTFHIQRECESEPICSTFEFEECELNQDEGIAEFYLDDYIECITNFIEYDVTDDTQISFHATLGDAESNSNALTSPFLNSTNPQFLNVRLEDSVTMEVVYTSIKLTATDCED